MFAGFCYIDVEVRNKKTKRRIRSEMKRRRKRKYITIKIFIKDEEVYINNNRVLDELKELKIVDMFWQYISREL